MKSKVVFIFIITLLINVIIWPVKVEPVVNNQYVMYPEKVIVKVEGEVVYPGVYTFFSKTTIREVLNQAGGYTNEAEDNEINLNEVIEKNKTIRINKIKHDDDNPPLHQVYNLNTVTFSQLITIPNITENRAANIILHRIQFGPFAFVEELINVKYIGSAVFEKISKYFTV